VGVAVRIEIPFPTKIKAKKIRCNFEAAPLEKCQRGGESGKLKRNVLVAGV